LSYSKKKRQLQEEKEARLNKTPEKETRSVIKQSKAFVRNVSYSYGIRLIYGSTINLFVFVHVQILFHKKKECTQAAMHYGTSMD
jgi:hypothetical protein